MNREEEIEPQSTQRPQRSFKDREDKKTNKTEKITLFVKGNAE
jgi:hypothetical protein